MYVELGAEGVIMYGYQQRRGCCLTCGVDIYCGELIGKGAHAISLIWTITLAYGIGF